jgi:hypothetical protein
MILASGSGSRRDRRAIGRSASGLGDCNLFVNMLPIIEQQPLYNGWNFSNGFDNRYSSTARSATILSCLLCPADIIPQNPVQNGTSNEWYGITSYGGNAGTQSHPFSAVTSDVIFFYTGPAAPGFSQVRISGVRDGLSNTLFFGERNHFDLVAWRGPRV